MGCGNTSRERKAAKRVNQQGLHDKDERTARFAAYAWMHGVGLHVRRVVKI